MPPFSFIGLALKVVMVSKQEAKVTIGASVPLMIISIELDGLFVTQLRFEVITHLTLSPLFGW
jgi:hypothetical protein